MKTAIRLTSVVMAMAFCASAFASEPSKPVVKLSKKTTHKVCYTVITGSGVPQPCDRLAGIPTTADALLILGNKGERY